MRNGAIVACLAFMACQNEQELRYTSTLEAPTRGVALSEDGRDGHAAMSGTTCTIDTSWGCPTSDADLPTPEEVVLDHHAGVTLGRSSHGLHRVDRTGWLREKDIELPSPHAAKLTDDGLLALYGDGDACWLQGETGDPVSVPGAACGDGVRVGVDRSGGTLFIGTGEKVLALDRDGATTVTEGFDLIAWDQTLKQLYLANTGEREIKAVSKKGEERWTAEAQGPITSIAARGKRGEVLVLSSTSDGLGMLERLDGETGRHLGESQLPDADADLEVSDNGLTVATVREDEVNFFSYDLQGEERDIDPDPPKCISPERRTAD